MSANRVGIVLVNWNGWRDTVRCLDSLRLLEDVNFQIIVVDNCSTDDSRENLQGLHGITLLLSEKNRGFSGGCNIGINYALEKGCDYVWLLNNDTVVFPDTLDEMLQKLEDPKIGMVGSILYSIDGSSIETYGGGIVNKWLATTKNIFSPKRIDRLNFLCGASLLIPKRVIDVVGLWDENYFLYWEDVDYSFRVQDAGFGLAVAAKSRVKHMHGSSTSKLSKKRIEYVTLGMVRFFSKRKAYFPIIIGVISRALKQIATLQFANLSHLFRGVWFGLKSVF